MVEEKKKYYRISEIQDQVFEIKNESFSKGWSTGFASLDELISYKRGYSTIIYSYSHQGKTQFAIEECVHMAKEFGVVSVVYLTEAGTMGDTILDIIQTYLGKNLSVEVVEDVQILEALIWADNHFVLLDSIDTLLTIREIYSEILKIKKETGLDIGNLVIDHYGNLEKDEKQKYFNVSENVKYVLQAVTRCSKKFNLHTFILFHVRDTDPIKCKITEKFYLPKPEHYEIAGGQQVNFLGQQMICVWRPISSPEKFGIIDPDTAMPYDINETRITVSKSKPKMIGRLGTQGIYFDVPTQRYYEEIGGRKYFAREYAESTQPKKKETSKPKPAAAPVKYKSLVDDSGGLRPNTSFDDDAVLEMEPKNDMQEWF